MDEESAYSAGQIVCTQKGEASKKGESNKDESSTEGGDRGDKGDKNDKGDKVDTIEIEDDLLVLHQSCHVLNSRTAAKSDYYVLAFYMHANEGE